MKIEKRKVTEAKPLSVAAKSAMGVMLGMTTAATFIACGGPVGEISDAIDENSSSSNEIQTPKSDSSSPESSNQAETQQSSSEQSEAQQNSAEQTDAQQSGQEQTETKQSSSSQVVVDIPLSHEPISSSVLEALSSVTESDSSANNRCIAVPGSEITVCTQTPSSSSSSNAQSSSSSANNACTNVPGSDIIICPDQSLPHSSAMTSMVTTFEKTDIEV